MERISEFQRIIRTLCQATWLLLCIIVICAAIHIDLQFAWITYVLVAIYGMYLYLYQHGRGYRPTTTGHFMLEATLILLLDWASRSPLVIYLFPLLILRRAAFAREPNIYLEAVFVGVLYLGSRWLHDAYAYYAPWTYAISDVFMIGLAVLLAQPVVQLTKSLQADREKLRQKLNKAEESYQRAAELALRDGLTGLYNYRALQEHISRLDDADFAILLMDVDHFKVFNDQYGHMVGDRVLFQIGQVILENVRRSDKVYRYGGEEFAVVLEDADDEMALFTAERIRSRVANQALECSGQMLKSITISLGVAVFKESKMSGYQMLEQADKALYEAKARGRNNVVFFMEPTISV